MPAGLVDEDHTVQYKGWPKRQEDQQQEGPKRRTLIVARHVGWHFLVVALASDSNSVALEC